MHQHFIKALHRFAQPHVALGSAIVLGALILGGAWYLTNVSATGAYTRVERMTLAEEVDASGSVEGAETTDLAFQIGGQIAGTPVPVGTHVAAGQVLVALAGGSQAAALAGAKANLEAAQARYAALLAGTRPEQITVDQTTLRNSTMSAYIAADSAVHTTADQLFSNPRTASAQLTLNVPDLALSNKLLAERIALEPVLAHLGVTVGASAFATADPALGAAEAAGVLSQVSTLLDDSAAAVAKTQPSASISATTLAGYASSLAAARTTIAASQSALAGAQGALALAQAPATATDLASAQAAVDAAQAAVDAAAVAAGQTVLTAPISGVVTVQNAHRGATATPGVPLVSLQGDAGFEAKLAISEANIGKLKVGQSAVATFDAYPGQSFAATITRVDPAATIAGGIASYQVVATFANRDPRIQSGLTAHVAVTTATEANVLAIPSSAVITEGSEHFVYAKSGSGTVRAPVELGIESATGLVEVRSGLAEGAEVLTFGASQ